MRGSELTEAMAVIVDRLVSAREGTSALDRAIEATVDKIGWFNGKDAISYLEFYRAEMLMRNIPEEKRLIGSPRVVTPSIHAECSKYKRTAVIGRTLRDDSLNGKTSMTRSSC